MLIRASVLGKGSSLILDDQVKEMVWGERKMERIGACLGLDALLRLVLYGAIAGTRGGDDVREGQPAGRLHFIDTPWREPVVETFRATGHVLCLRAPGWTERGSCLGHLASDRR